MFDPLDDAWWTAGSSLNWWEPGIGVRPPWLPDAEAASARLRRRLPTVVAALSLAHQYRTCTTGQLNALDPSLPASAAASLWLDMAGCSLIDLGYPMALNGRNAGTPRTAPWMAVRLPTHGRIEKRLEALGCTPVQVASIGPGPLRGARQYDRHNLVCSQLAVEAGRTGWRTAGELYGRFSLMTGDAAMGNGGPDLILFGEGRTLCVELTASANLGLKDKFERWDRVLAHPGSDRLEVWWLDATRGPDDPLLSTLAHLCADRPRQHAAPAAGWVDSLPGPGTPSRPSDWVRATFDRIAVAFGFPASAGWRIPEALTV